MPTGKIKMFNPDKGFGFITADDGSGDFFMHVKDLARGEVEESLVYDARVSFDLAHGDRGTRAVKVKVAVVTAEVNGHQPADFAQEGGPVTVAEAIAGLKAAFLAGLEWLDLLEAACTAEGVTRS